MKLTPIILSGGSGTRLWPISRKQYPKQFCDLLDKPLQTLTIERLQKYGEGLIVTSTALKDLTEKNISENQLQISKVLYEPVGKNTAAAVALACRYLELHNRAQEIVGVFPSDAQILKTEVLDSVLQKAYEEAQSGAVIILGIQPKTPETGFGYIQLGSAGEVLKFHEKPDLETAQKFLAAKNYFWNAGIFIFKVSSMIEHFKSHESDLWKKMSSLKNDLSNLDEIYSALKSISIDYAIIEKLNSNQLKSIPCNMGWSDLGSWDAVIENTESHVPVTEVASKGNIVFSKQKKLYSVVGCDDLIIVDTGDALMICKKGQSQKVKELVENLEKNNPKVVS